MFFWVLLLIMSVTPKKIVQNVEVVEFAQTVMVKEKILAIHVMVMVNVPSVMVEVEIPVVNVMVKGVLGVMNVVALVPAENAAVLEKYVAIHVVEEEEEMMAVFVLCVKVQDI